MIMREMLVALSVFTLSLNQACKNRNAELASGDNAAASSAPKLVAGTDEAVRVFPPLDTEHPYDPAAEKEEFSFYQDMVHFLQDEMMAKHSPKADKPLRGFHAKAHGCLAGNFYVVSQPKFSEAYGNRIGSETHSGIFDSNFGGDTKNIPAGFSHSYPVLARFSNAQGKRQSDGKIDGKGLAIKVMGDKNASGEHFEQDFTMSDTPTCNATTAARFMALGMALAGISEEINLPTGGALATDANGEMTEQAQESYLEQWRNYLLGFDPDPYFQGFIKRHLDVRRQNLKELLPPALAFMAQKDNEPTKKAILQMIRESFGKFNSAKLQYWSRTPYYNGGHAAKFTVLPRNCSDSDFSEISGAKSTPAPTGFLGGIQKIKNTFKNWSIYTTERVRKYTTTDSFRRNLSDSATQPICYDFAYQFQSSPDETPVENPTVVWPRDKSPPVVFAKVVLPPQSFDSDEQNAMCENLGWSPENFIPEHHPMGHMNRARLAVYRASREHRHGGQATVGDARGYKVVLLKK